MAMKMFYDWTPQNHGDFLSGLITGMKFVDNTTPPVKDTTTTKPININGKKGLGITVSQALVDENGIATIDVFTRNVEEQTKYGMFSATLTWDSSRATVYQMVNGEFGTIGTDVVATVGTGKLNVIGQKEDGTHFSEPQRLFSVKFAVAGEVTVNTPIVINIESTSNYNQDAQTIIDNYSTLLQMRQNVWGFIAPLDNVNGAIVSDKETQIGNLDNGTGTNGVGSPSSISMGNGCVGPGVLGYIPIWVNENINDEFPYNKFSYRMVIDNSDNAISFIKFTGAYGWDLSYTTSVEGTTITVDVVGTLDRTVEGLETVGYMELVANSEDYAKYLLVRDCKLWNDDKEFGVINNDGFVYFPASSGDGGGDNSYGGFPVKGGTGDTLNGGYGVTGDIWSGTEQTVWISIGGGPAVPVHLMPGTNHINVYVPYIMSDDNVDPDTGQLQIESEDYIWIPAGFKIIKIPPEKSSASLLIMNYIDKSKQVDLIEMTLQHIEPPVDLDNIIDNVYTADLMDMNIRVVNRKYVDEIDEQSLIDLFELYIKSMPKDIDLREIDTVADVEVFDLYLRQFLKIELGLTDERQITDYHEIITRAVTRKTDSLNESSNVDDNSVMFEFAQYYTITGSVDDASHGSITGLGTFEGDKYITLRSVANTGWQVDKWYVGGVVVSDKAFYRFKLLANTNVYLTFKVR